MAGCNSNFLVHYQKFKLQKIDIKLTEKKDSLSLFYEIDFPPKSFGKKAIVVFQPLLILKNDTIFFKTNTIEGEKYDDGLAIQYQLNCGTRFYDTIRIPETLEEKGILKILIYGYYKNGGKKISIYEKELEIK